MLHAQVLDAAAQATVVEMTEPVDALDRAQPRPQTSELDPQSERRSGQRRLIDGSGASRVCRPHATTRRPVTAAGAHSTPAQCHPPRTTNQIRHEYRRLLDTMPLPQQHQTGPPKRPERPSQPHDPPDRLQRRDIEPPHRRGERLNPGNPRHPPRITLPTLEAERPRSRIGRLHVDSSKSRGSTPRVTSVKDRGGFVAQRTTLRIKIFPTNFSAIICLRCGDDLFNYLGLGVA